MTYQGKTNIEEFYKPTYSTMLVEKWLMITESECFFKEAELIFPLNLFLAILNLCLIFSPKVCKLLLSTNCSFPYCYNSVTAITVNIAIINGEYSKLFRMKYIIPSKKIFQSFNYYT